MGYTLEENKKQLAEIADFFDANPDIDFDMANTRCCILGWACRLGKDAISEFPVNDQPVNTFAWLYDARWKAVDNSIQGAVKRIRYFIEYDVPDDCVYQLRGIDYMFAAS